jgi:peptidoglycan/LPS O-acetylase OafA/YrhL
MRTKIDRLMTNNGADAPAVRRAADIPSLDGLRAISIVLVLAAHAICAGQHSFWFRALFLHAALGVRVFFVISGFLITGLLLKERDQSDSISLRLFYIRRALRILPAFFLFVGCVALLSISGITFVPSGLWFYVFTYTVNYSPFGVWVLGHLWSLSVEEQFYLLWPLIMKIARPRTCAVVAILAIAANPATHAVHRLSGMTLSSYGFALQCGPIAMGCLLAMKARTVRRWIVSSKLLSDGRSLVFTVILLALLDAIPNHFGAPSVFLEIVMNSLLTFCVARLVFIPHGVAGRVLNSAPFVLIGKLSYSLYLWQQLFLKPEGDAPISISFPLNLIAAIAAASACYWGLEVRFLRLRKKFRTPSQSGVSALAAGSVPMKG